MDILFTTIEMVCIAVGAGSAFIFDVFFIVSARNHKIQPVELAALKRLSLYSIVAAAIALCSYMISLAYVFDTAADIRISISLAILIILTVALLCAVTLRKIHLQALVRHQNQYGHLSEHMLDHPNPLVATAAYSSVSWMAVIFLSAIEYRGAESAFHFGFVSIMLVYIILGYLAGHLGIYIKRYVSAENRTFRKLKADNMAENRKTQPKQGKNA